MDFGRGKLPDHAHFYVCPAARVSGECKSWVCLVAGRIQPKAGASHCMRDRWSTWE